jgi:hypothetical protein
VQRILGHASAAITLDVYSELFDSDLDTVADALDYAAMKSDVGKMWAESHNRVLEAPEMKVPGSLYLQGNRAVVTPTGFEPVLPP